MACCKIHAGISQFRGHSGREHRTWHIRQLLFPYFYKETESRIFTRVDELVWSVLLINFARVSKVCYDYFATWNQERFLTPTMLTRMAATVGDKQETKRVCRHHSHGAAVVLVVHAPE